MSYDHDEDDQDEGFRPGDDPGRDEDSWQVEEPPENPFEEPPPPLEEGAIAPQSESDRAEKPTLVDFLRSHLLTTDTLDTIPDPEPLIGSEVLFIDTLNWLVGKPGDGKSFVALDLAGCVATGIRWHGHSVRQGRVLYIAAEGVRGVKRRVRAWEHKHGAKMAGVDFLPFPVQSTNGGHWDALVGLAAEVDYTLIVVDTQARVTVGVEENSNKEMGTFVHQAERLRQASAACTILVHHTGAGSERGRGATTLDGALTTIMLCEKSGSVITLKCQKNKDAPQWDSFEFQLIPQVQSAVLVATVNIGTDLIRSVPPEMMRTALKWWTTYGTEWHGSKDLEEATDLPRQTFSRHRRELARMGYVEAMGTTVYKYRLTGDPAIAPADRPPEPEPTPETPPPAAPDPLF
jgi:hypothetical protein